MSSPPAWALVTRPQFSLPLGVRFLEKQISVSADPGYKVSTDPADSASSQTQRMRVMGPRTLLLLFSGALVMTETRAGEYGVGRERPLRGRARGPPGSLGGRTPGNQRPRRPCPDPPPPRVPACPSLASRPLFSPSGVRAGLRPLPSHRPYAPSALPAPSAPTRDPRREGVGPGLTPSRPQAPTP